MKLSEAIRLGAMVTKQADGKFITADGQRTCAQGAALLAVGRIVREPYGDMMNHAAVDDEWPWLRRVSSDCPHVGCSFRMRVRSLIPHLNNDNFGLWGHGWSRERIADWVATVEPAEIPLAESVTDVTLDDVTTTAHQEAHA